MSSGKAQRVKDYLDKHQIGALFEEMMGKLIVEQPRDPLLYISGLIEDKRSHNKESSLLKKSGSTNLKHLDKNVKNQSDKPRTTAAALDMNKKHVDHSMSKKGEDLDSSKRVADPSLLMTGADLKAADMRPTEASNVHDVIGGNKIKSSGVGAEWIKLSAYHNFFSKALKEDDLLLDEMPASLRKSNSIDVPSNSKMMSVAEAVLTISAGKRSVKNFKEDKQKNREAFTEFLLKQSNDDRDSGYHEIDLQHDEAVELWEDLDALKSEGVNVMELPTVTPGSRQVVRRPATTAPPAAAACELRVGICARCARVMEDGFEDAASEMSRSSRGSRTPVRSEAMFDDDDDEFESVSQVTGPRRPVWNENDNNYEQKRTTSSLPNLPKPITPVLKATASLDNRDKAVKQSCGNSDSIVAAVRDIVDRSASHSRAGSQASRQSDRQRPPSRHEERSASRQELIGGRADTSAGRESIARSAGSRESIARSIGSRESIARSAGSRPSNDSYVDVPVRRQSVDRATGRPQPHKQEQERPLSRHGSRQSLTHSELSGGLSGAGWNVVDAMDSDDSSTAYVTGKGSTERKPLKPRVY